MPLRAVPPAEVFIKSIVNYADKPSVKTLQRLDRPRTQHLQKEDGNSLQTSSSSQKLITAKSQEMAASKPCLEPKIGKQQNDAILLRKGCIVHYEKDAPPLIPLAADKKSPNVPQARKSGDNRHSRKSLISINLSGEFSCPVQQTELEDVFQNISNVGLKNTSAEMSSLSEMEARDPHECTTIEALDQMKSVMSGAMWLPVESDNATALDLIDGRTNSVTPTLVNPELSIQENEANSITCQPDFQDKGTKMPLSLAIGTKVKSTPKAAPSELKSTNDNPEVLTKDKLRVSPNDLHRNFGPNLENSTSSFQILKNGFMEQEVDSESAVKFEPEKSREILPSSKCMSSMADAELVRPSSPTVHFPDLSSRMKVHNQKNSARYDVESLDGDKPVADIKIHCPKSYDLQLVMMEGEKNVPNKSPSSDSDFLALGVEHDPNSESCSQQQKTEINVRTSKSSDSSPADSVFKPAEGEHDSLLMSEAYHKNIVTPSFQNSTTGKPESTLNGIKSDSKLLEYMLVTKENSANIHVGSAFATPASSLDGAGPEILDDGCKVVESQGEPQDMLRVCQTSAPIEASKAKRDTRARLLDSVRKIVRVQALWRNKTHTLDSSKSPLHDAGLNALTIDPHQSSKIPNLQMKSGDGTTDAVICPEGQDSVQIPKHSNMRTPSSSTASLADSELKREDAESQPHGELGRSESNAIMLPPPGEVLIGDKQGISTEKAPQKKSHDLRSKSHSIVLYPCASSEASQGDTFEGIDDTESDTSSRSHDSGLHQVAAKDPPTHVEVESRDKSQALGLHNIHRIDIYSLPSVFEADQDNGLTELDFYSSQKDKKFSVDVDNEIFLIAKMEDELEKVITVTEARMGRH